VKGKKLAELCEKYVKSIGQNSRGIKTGDRLYFIRKTAMPAVLCECAFIDNKKDNTIIDTVAEQKSFGVAYAKAILEYFGIAYKEANQKIYRVQVGAYSKREYAEALVRELKARGYDAIVV
jgi:N-acetylmuramoyl-L-alanine amidase